MDPPQQQPPFPPFPAAGGTPATVHPAAPTISTAQIIPESVQNHIAHVANPTPAVTQNHPPYTDMIYAAITALKEKDGSSKRAIAKYIEKVYTGLPPTHTALLTHHLKRLKNTGLLEMVKKSYKLPRSDSTIGNNLNNNDDNTTTASALSPTQPHPLAVPAASALSGPKRGRGRPPKAKPNSVPEAVSSQPVMVPVGLSITAQPNVAPANNLLAQSLIPPPPPDNNFNNVNVNANASAHVQLQMEAKRGPGRPKKVGGQVGASVVAAAGGKRRGRPPKSGAMGPKKNTGRPKKLKSVAANGVKKVVPKRLPKSVVVPYATGAAVVNVPRTRGRPKKGTVLAASGGGVVVHSKRAGRPPKVAGIVRPKKRGARPVGRPKKNVWGVTESSQLQAEAYGDLKKKFEFFQSRVKQAVNVLKPTLTTEAAIHAVAELENLASMGINVPSKEEASQPQPQSQPQQGIPLPPQPAIIQN